MKFEPTWICMYAGWCRVYQTTTDTDSPPPAHSLLCFPANPTDLPACTPTTPSRRHTELLSKMHPTPALGTSDTQSNKGLCLEDDTHAASWREKQKKSACNFLFTESRCGCIFFLPNLLINVFSLFLNSRGNKEKSKRISGDSWKQNEPRTFQRSLQQSKQLYSTRSRCLYYVRQYITSRFSNVYTHLRVKQRLTVDTAAKSGPE